MGKYRNFFISGEMSKKCPKIFICIPIPYTGITHYIYIQELVVRARQLDFLTQLFRALDRNRRAAGWIPARGSIVAHFAVALG